MAEISVAPSTANAAKDSLVWELAALVNDLAAAVNEIKADFNLLRTDATNLATLANEVKADFNAHTHNADGAQVGSYYTSPPRTNAATVTLGTAATVLAADVTVSATAVAAANVDTIKFKGLGTP